MAKRRSKERRARSGVASTELVGWAVEGLQREIAATRERLASLTATAARLRQRFGGRANAVAPVSIGGKGSRRNRMTEEGRKKISEMMKKRWADAKRKKQNRLT